ncbi:N-acetyltransferase YedL [Bordetella tumbae]|uniref:hypothetical protein n=1 Tax=Bordetella tumbae TaxID=1649139 RepID=UPI0039F10A16
MDLRRMHNRYCSLAFATLSALGGMAGISAANAADAPTAASIQSQYEHDVQRCNSGQTNQSKAVCLQEAGAAREEAQRKRLDDGQSANYGNNSVDRCTKLPQPQRQDCLQQMQSPSTVKGSVESGGVLRETVIPVPPSQTGTTPGTSGTMPGSSTAPGAVPGAAPGSSTTPGTVTTPPAGTPATPVPVQQ